MRHFGYLTAGQDDSLFDHVPQPFGRDSDRQTLAAIVALALLAYFLRRWWIRRKQEH